MGNTVLTTFVSAGDRQPTGSCPHVTHSPGPPSRIFAFFFFFPFAFAMAQQVDHYYVETWARCIIDLLHATKLVSKAKAFFFASS